MLDAVTIDFGRDSVGFVVLFVSVLRDVLEDCARRVLADLDTEPLGVDLAILEAVGD